MNRSRWTLLFSAFRGGWTAALRMPLLITILWLVNMVASACALSFFWGILADYVGQSGLHDSAFTLLQFDDLLEFWVAREEQLPYAALPFLLAGGVYLLVKVYLTAGILERLKNGSRCSWQEFFRACGREFGRLVVLTVVTGALALTGFGIMMSVIGMIDKYLRSSVNHPAPIFWTNLVLGLLLFLLFSFVARVYDYARIALFLTPQHSIFNVLRNGLQFPLQHGIHTFVLWCGYFAISAALAAAYAWITAHALPESMNAVWMQFLLGQIVVFGRIGCRIASLAGQMRFMRTQLS